MNTNNHKHEIDEIQKHVRMLNITGAVAICALALAGALLVSDIFEAPAPVQESRNSELHVSPVALASLENTQEASLFPEVSVTENAAIEKVMKKSKPEEAEENAVSKNESTTFEEELQSFEASCNKGAILFQWVTIGGSKHGYEIEKTYDQVNYEVFIRAGAPEKKDGKNIYAVEETATVGDDAFYRLRKVMGKGKYEYSEAVKVKCASDEAHAATIDVFPNGNGSFRIMIHTEIPGTYKVTLSDATDKELATQDFVTIAGNNEFILNSSGIEKGNYVLRVSNDSMVKEKKVVLK